MAERQEPPQPAKLLLAEHRDLVEIFHPAQQPDQNRQQHLIQRIGHHARSMVVLHRLDMIQKRRVARIRRASLAANRKPLRKSVHQQFMTLPWGAHPRSIDRRNDAIVALGSDVGRPLIQPEARAKSAAEVPTTRVKPRPANDHPAGATAKAAGHARLVRKQRIHAPVTKMKAASAVGVQHLAG